ncbi:MAG: nitroreductase family protein [Calditrichia bacterium]
MKNTSEILDLIKSRRSLRSFADKPVSATTISTIFEAARWAPSSRNEQPWRFLVATKNQPEAYQKILDALNLSNREWAQRAPVLILTIAKKAFDHNNAPNAHAWHDVGLAIGNVNIQATAMGLVLHQMGGFNPNVAIENFRIPENFEPVTIIAMGYPGDPDMLTEKLQMLEKAPRSRKSLSEIVFTGKWGRGIDEHNPDF